MCALSSLSCSPAAAEATACGRLSVKILHASRDSCVLSHLQSTCPVLPKQPRADVSSLCSSTSVKVTFPNSPHVGVNDEKLPKQSSTHRPSACRVHKSRAVSAASTKPLGLLSVAETTHRRLICLQLPPQPVTDAHCVSVSAPGCRRSNCQFFPSPQP